MSQIRHHEVIVEAMSGETMSVPVSALKRTGLEELTEADILLHVIDAAQTGVEERMEVVAEILTSSIIPVKK